MWDVGPLRSPSWPVGMEDGIYFSFSPLFGEDFQFNKYFSNGLVQPPPSMLFQIAKRAHHDLRFPTSKFEHMC